MPITGIVRALDGFTVTIETASGLHVAVDIEDCYPMAKVGPGTGAA